MTSKKRKNDRLMFTHAAYERLGIREQCAERTLLVARTVVSSSAWDGSLIIKSYSPNYRNSLDIRGGPVTWGRVR
jgi:hypothetical protein